MMNMNIKENNHKSCSKCLEIKTINQFNKKSRSISGFRPECKFCQKISAIKYREKNGEAIRRKNRLRLKSEERKQYEKEYRIKNADKIQDILHQWYLKNKDLVNSKSVEWARKNRPKRRIIEAQYRISHPGYNAEKVGRRRSRRIMSMPKWLSEAQLLELKLIYENCPPGHHVDHIVPLQGDNISGLHVPWNLQYLPASDNLKKSNKF